MHTADRNLLDLLIWNLTYTGQISEAFYWWNASGNAFAVRKRLIELFQAAETPSEMVFSLVALISLEKLRCHSGVTTKVVITDEAPLHCLADLHDFLLRGVHVSTTVNTLEHMLRSLYAISLSAKITGLDQLVGFVIDYACLKPQDLHACTSRYWMLRAFYGLPHGKAFEIVYEEVASFYHAMPTLSDLASRHSNVLDFIKEVGCRPQLSERIEGSLGKDGDI